MPIKVKEKPCKGTGKAKGYGCGKPQLKRTYGLGYDCKCYPKWLYSTKEGQEKVRKSTLKATKDRLDLESATIRVKSERRLPLALEATKKAVHQYIRKRDHGKPCISCGTPFKEDHQAGHYYKSEKYSLLRFDVLNIHGQCVRCNLSLEGNFDEYSLRIGDRIGKENVDYLNKKAREEFKTNHKWDLDELKKIRENIKKLTKEL